MVARDLAVSELAITQSEIPLLTESMGKGVRAKRADISDRKELGLKCACRISTRFFLSHLNTFQTKRMYRPLAGIIIDSTPNSSRPEFNSSEVGRASQSIDIL